MEPSTDASKKQDLVCPARVSPFPGDRVQELDADGT
jgi:hypothetical protein